MTLRHGRPQVAIPGPSIIPARVLAAMQRSMPNIYEGPLVDVSNSLFADLPKLARTEGEAFILIGNGHAAWQMAVSNTMSTPLVTRRCSWSTRSHRWRASRSRWTSGESTSPLRRARRG